MLSIAGIDDGIHRVEPCDLRKRRTARRVAEAQSFALRQPVRKQKDALATQTSPLAAVIVHA